MRIPYTQPLPLAQSLPASASTVKGAVDALQNFLGRNNGDTLILSGAGISVASGLADYRGTKGTYILNKTYRPIYFHEFAASHEARKRYWARSFLGWTTLHRSKPNAAHYAVRQLGELGIVNSVITQNVDSFHSQAMGAKQKVIELHGYLRATVCLTCKTEYSRDEFQQDLANLNPSWEAFLAEMLESGALGTEDPGERRNLGLKTNPDGDVDVPGVNYNTFRYPACPKCLADRIAKVLLDEDGAWAQGSVGGILKPAVIMFGESIPAHVKTAAETAVDNAGSVMVLGSSLATYSAWRLVKRAQDQGKRIAIINMGGVRGEEAFFAGVPIGTDGWEGVRCSLPLEESLPALLERLQQERDGRKVFKPAPWA